MIGDLGNYCFHLSRSQGVSGLRTSRGNQDTILVGRSCAIKLAFCSNSDSSSDALGWCPLILFSDQC